MKKNDGQNLQRLIRAIESVRNSNVKVKIESRKRVRDKITGKLREHDVVLTYALAHRELVLALECRDRSRPVGVDAVEAFRSKCESTDIHSGIIVSANGFAKTAIKKAAGYNIGCLTLDQVERVDWCHAPGIFVRSRLMTGSHMYIEFPDGTDLSGIITSEDGKPLPKERVGPIALQNFQMNQEKFPAAVGGHTVRMHDLSPSFYMTHGDERIRATKLVLTIKYTVKEVLSPFEFRKYFDRGKSKPITEAAVAAVPLGDRTGEIVLATEEDGSITVSLVTGPKIISSRGAV